MIVFLGRTHVIISLVIYSIVHNYIDRPIPLVILFITVGSLLADIDSPDSVIGRWIYPISAVTEHRNGYTHSILGVFLFSLPALLLFDKVYFIIFLLSYSLHILMDLLTPAGIKLLYPFKTKSYSLNLIKTNSLEENFIFALSLLYLFKVGY